MKILQINAVGQTSSTGRNCKEIADYINTKTEHICMTAFAQGKEDEFSFRIGNKFDWKLHGLLSRLTGKQAYYSKFSTKNLIKRIVKEKIDVVHFGNVHGNYLDFPQIMKFLNESNIPVVLTLHDCWFYTGKCCHYTLENCYRWKEGCFNCPKLRNDNPSWFFDRTKRLWKDKKELFMNCNNLAVVGVSDWITNEAKESILKSANILKRIYNWIDLEVFKSVDVKELKKNLDLNKKYVILGVSSRWDNEKGLDKFLELASNLNSDEVIILVGEMDNTVNLPNNIVSVGKTESIEQLVKYYNLADVFLTMSLQESFGKVSAEALACQTPVICFDSTANKELVDEFTGRVIGVEKGILGIRDAISELKKNCTEEMKEACRERAEKLFSKESNILEYLVLYETLVRGATR